MTVGLAPSTTKEAVQNLFSKFGIVKDVRLVTFKTGVPKGDSSFVTYALDKIY